MLKIGTFDLSFVFTQIMLTIYNHNFWVKFYKNYLEVNTMKGRILTGKQITAFAVYLKSEEKSKNTVEKYIRDVRAFAAYVGDAVITKETVIANFIEKNPHLS